MVRSSYRSIEKKKNFSDFLINMKDIPFVKKTGGAMSSSCQTMCFASRCWTAKYLIHFSWQNALMESSYLGVLDF